MKEKEKELRESITHKTILTQQQNLTGAELGLLFKDLKTKFGLSNRQIGKLYDRPHSTVHDWISGRQSNKPGSLHVSITSLIRHFEVYEPKSLTEWGLLVKLNKLLTERIKKSPIENINKNLGWEDE